MVIVGHNVISVPRDRRPNGLFAPVIIPPIAGVKGLLNANDLIATKGFQVFDWGLAKVLTGAAGAGHYLTATTTIGCSRFTI